MAIDHPEDWRILAARKRKQVDSQIPTAWRLDGALLASVLESGKLLEADIPRRSGILSEQEIEITEQYSAEQLLRRLAQGGVTSLAVTTAFCKRAAIAQQLVRLGVKPKLMMANMDSQLSWTFPHVLALSTTASN